MAGLLITLPSFENLEPWHGQSHVFSSGFQVRAHLLRDGFNKLAVALQMLTASFLWRIEAGCDIYIVGAFRVVSDIWDFIKCHTVLCRISVTFGCFRIMFFCKAAYIGIATGTFSGFMTAANNKQHVFIIS